MTFHSGSPRLHAAPEAGVRRQHAAPLEAAADAAQALGQGEDLEVAAVDYLLKPFDPHRLVEALERAASAASAPCSGGRGGSCDRAAARAVARRNQALRGSASAAMTAALP
ncbi:MAG: hypothetical protein WEB88_08100 [Gemmatimonadota bacterium]